MQVTYFNAQFCGQSVTPKLLCGRCSSPLSRSRMFEAEAGQFPDPACITVGICSADDCDAVNCCDHAIARMPKPESYTLLRQ